MDSHRVVHCPAQRTMFPAPRTIIKHIKYTFSSNIPRNRASPSAAWATRAHNIQSLSATRQSRDMFSLDDADTSVRSHLRILRARSIEQQHTSALHLYMWRTRYTQLRPHVMFNYLENVMLRVESHAVWQCSLQKHARIVVYFFYFIFCPSIVYGVFARLILCLFFVFSFLLSTKIRISHLS